MYLNHTIFVSSTFKDMHAERDMIHDKVIPELSSALEGSSLEVDFVDLRWGINTESVDDENDAALKILQVCFDEIERSQPFFICLIGNRYGWVPSEQSVKSACMNAGIDHDEYIGKSITEIEVEYAMSKFPSYNNCFFFFRNGIEPDDIIDTELRDIYFPTDTDEIRKNELLKKRIREKYADRCFDYSCRWDNDAASIVGLEDLAGSIIDKISGVLDNHQDKGWDSLDVYGKEIAAQEAYYNSILSQCVIRPEYLDAIINDFIMIDTDQKEMMLIGESGYGKSTLLATLGRKLRSIDETYVINLFSGITAESLNFQFIVRYIYQKIARDFGFSAEEGDFSNTKQLLLSLISEASRQKRIVIIIDAINQLNRCPELDSLDWLNSFFIPENVRIVYSTLPGTFDSAISGRNIKTLQVGGLNAVEIQKIASSAAAKKHKQLPDTVFEALLSKKDAKGNASCSNPLYVSMLIEYISEFDIDDYEKIMLLEQELKSGTKAINTYITDKVLSLPGEIDALYSLLMKKCRKAISSDKAEFITALLSDSRFGVREDDVYGISARYGLDISSADFSVYRKMLRMHLIRRNDGRWDFRHSIIKNNSAREKSAIDRNRLHSDICSYLMGLPKSDEFRQEEIAYYHIKNGLFAQFIQCVKEGGRSAVENREIFLQLCELYTNESYPSEDFWPVCLSYDAMDTVCGIIYEIMDDGMCRSVEYHRQLRMFIFMNGSLQRQIKGGARDFQYIIENYIVCGKLMCYLGDKNASSMFRTALRVMERKCISRFLKDYSAVLSFLVENNRFGDSLHFSRMMLRSLKNKKNKKAIRNHNECVAYCSYYMAVSLKGDPVSFSRKSVKKWLCLSLRNASIESDIYYECVAELSDKKLKGKDKEIFDEAVVYLQKNSDQILKYYKYVLADLERSKSPDRPERYRALLNDLKNVLISGETYEALVLYQKCVEDFFYIAVAQKGFDAKELRDSVQLDRSLCKKLFSLTGDRLWNEKVIEIDEDALRLETGDSGFAERTQDDLKASMEMALSLPPKGYTTRFNQFITAMLWALLLSVFLFWFGIYPIIMIADGTHFFETILGLNQGTTYGFSMTISEIIGSLVLGKAFSDIMQFIYAFILALCAIQIHRTQHFHSKKGFAYRFEKKKLYQYLAFGLSFIALEFLFGAAKEGLFSWYRGKEIQILGDFGYYVLNAILVFIIGWYVTLVIYQIVGIRTRMIDEKRAFRRAFYLKESVIAGLIRLGIMAVLPVVFRLIMISGNVTEKLTYTGLRAEDFWKIFWLPFLIEAIILLLQIGKSRMLKQKRFSGVQCEPRQERPAMSKNKPAFARYFIIPLVLYLAVGTFIAAELYYGKMEYDSKDHGEVKYLYTEDFEYLIRNDAILLNKYIGQSEGVNIPARIDDVSVEIISSKCFSGCSVKSISIPDTVTSIEEWAFADCESLEMIDLGIGITKIQKSAFNNCISLKSIVLPEGIEKLTNRLFSGCSNLTSVQLPDSVISIEEEAFLKCVSLKEIRLPARLESIGKEAFKKCERLAEISIPDSVLEIGNRAFEECISLDRVSVGGGLKDLGRSVFANCRSLKTVLFREGIGTISEGTFGGCSCLSDVVLPRSLTEIGKNAFSGCISLESLSLPDRIESIEDSAFNNCGLLEINMPDSVLRMGDSLFEDSTKLESVVIGSGVMTIGNCVFKGCSGLSRVLLGENVIEINDNAFSGCDHILYNEYENCCYLGTSANPYYALAKPKDNTLTECIVNNNTKLICEGALMDCDELQRVVMGDSVANINGYAFWNCSKLTNVKLGNGIERIGTLAFSSYDKVRFNEYDGCRYLGSDTNPYLALITTIEEPAAECTTHKHTRLVIDSAFEDCSELKSVTLSEGVLYIGEYAFRHCSSLTSIIIPDSVISIGNGAFSSCKSLTAIELPDRITGIAKNTFSYCNSLATVTIGENVTSIGESAFDGCVVLAEIRYNGTMDEWNRIAKDSYSNKDTGEHTIRCTDGDIPK